MKDKNGIRIHLVDPVTVTEPGENFGFTGHIMVICDSYVTVEARGGEERDIKPEHLEIQISKGNAIKRSIRDARKRHEDVESQWNGLTGEDSNMEFRVHHMPGVPKEPWYPCPYPEFKWLVLEYRVKA